MILHKSPGYWATGIVLRCDGQRWCGWIDYLDDGFCDDNADAGAISTEGTLRTRYMVWDGDQVSALSAVVDTLIADAAKLGIRLVNPFGGVPSLYYEGDGEDPTNPPPAGWRQLLAAEAARIGWQDPKADPEPTMAWVTLDDAGRLMSDSTVTVDGETWPIPERTEQAGILAPVRIGVALKERGWKAIRGSERERSEPGRVGIPVERIEEEV